MLYILADWVPSEDGYYPDLPKGCGFLCLAGSHRYAEFGLFSVSCPSDDDWEALCARSVPRALASLLGSAEQYPPAMAGASQALEKLAISDRGVFVSELERLLKDRLEAQRSARHVLLRSRVDEVGYRSDGEYVWVVGYRPQAVAQEVAWLASDFQVYTDAVESFDVSPAWLAERFGMPEAEPGAAAAGGA